MYQDKFKSHDGTNDHFSGDCDNNKSILTPEQIDYLKEGEAKENGTYCIVVGTGMHQHIEKVLKEHNSEVIIVGPGDVKTELLKSMASSMPEKLKAELQTKPEPFVIKAPPKLEPMYYGQPLTGREKRRARRKKNRK